MCVDSVKQSFGTTWKDSNTGHIRIAVAVCCSMSQYVAVMSQYLLALGQTCECQECQAIASAQREIKDGND